MQYDGHTIQIGSDVSTDTSELSRQYANISVNRKYRGGVNNTRDSFHSLRITGKQDDVDCYKYGSIHGAISFKGVKAGQRSAAVIAVSDRILAGRIRGNLIQLKTIYQGIDPSLHHGFFVQANDRIFFQNGRQNPLTWDGFESNQMEEVKEGFLGAGGQTIDSYMPIGNLMIYAHGRIFIGTENNVVYASNHIYGDGLYPDSSRNLANFSETTYPSSGDGFSAPADFGPLMGLATIPKHPSFNGHGEVLGMHFGGAYAVDVRLPRNQWTDEPIQTIILDGRGLAAYGSIVYVNNDVWFRSTDKSIASLKRLVNEQNQEWGYKSLSREVQQYLNLDSGAYIQHCKGIKGNNRLLFTTAIRGLDPLKDGEHKRIGGLGMVSMDLDSGSTTVPRRETTWDGIWTGPVVAETLSINNYGEERHLILSYDEDENRIYELNESSRNDIVDGKEKKIVSMYTVSDLFSQLNPREEPVFKTYNSSLLRYSDLHGEATITSFLKSEDYPCSAQIMDRNITNLSEDSKGKLVNNQPGSGKLYSDFRRQEYRIDNKQNLFTGESFTLVTKIEGKVAIRAHQLEVEIERDSDSTRKEEETNAVNCLPEEGKIFEYSLADD